MMNKRLLVLLAVMAMAGIAVSGEEKQQGKGVRITFFGLTLGQNIPANLKDKVFSNRILREVPKPDDDWETYAVIVTPTNRKVPSQGEYMVESITARKTFGSKEEAKTEYQNRYQQLKEDYGARPGQRFKVPGLRGRPVLTSWISMF